MSAVTVPCPKCSYKLALGKKLCPGCGRNVSDVTVAPKKVR